MGDTTIDWTDKTHNAWIGCQKVTEQECGVVMSQQGTLPEYRKPEHLNCQLEYLADDRYHLFVNGNWLYSFSDASVAYDCYRDYRKVGYACTVLAGQEIAFYCTTRKVST